MAYQTYTTEAIVCGAYNRNTADRSYQLFTREAGMLFATAKSVREERSRQRYALQEFTNLRVSLVRGKSGWRIGSIEPKYNFYHQAVDKSARGSVVNILRLLRRFLRGEEAQSELFDYTLEALDVLCGAVEQRGFVERAVTLQILLFLGYVDAGQIPPVIIACHPSHLAERWKESTENVLNDLYEKAISSSQL